MTKMDIVAGGGKYGSYAAEFLREKGRSFAIVDTDPNCLAAREFGLKSTTDFKCEGEYFIKGNLKTVLDLLVTARAEFVFPTVPTHLAADLAKIKFSLQPWIEGIDNIREADNGYTLELKDRKSSEVLRDIVMAGLEVQTFSRHLKELEERYMELIKGGIR